MVPMEDNLAKGCEMIIRWTEKQQQGGKTQLHGGKAVAGWWSLDVANVEGPGGTVSITNPLQKEGM